MPVPLLMPALSPTMKSGKIVRWIKKKGDKISSGDVLLEVETDKASMEVESVDRGILGRIVVADGTENVAVNSIIGVLISASENDSDIDKFIKDFSGSSDKSVKAEAPSIIDSKSNIVDSSNTAGLSSNTENDRIKASPLAKNIAKINGIDLSKVSGSGYFGRITRDDVNNFMASGASVNSNCPTSAVNRSISVEVPVSTMRKVIAERLCASKREVPHFYIKMEVNIDKLLEARVAINGKLDKIKDNKVKITVNDFVIIAVAMAMKKHKAVNMIWDNGKLIQNNDIDISVAVVLDDGLITPIIKNANFKSLQDISIEMKDLASRAKKGALKPDEFQGGSITISNLGMYGVTEFQAIINQPQSSILAVGAGRKIPVVDENNNIKISSVMCLTLSVDHRVVDGVLAAEFLSSIKDFLENPVFMIL